MHRILAVALGAAATALLFTPLNATAQTPITLRLHTFLPPVANPVKHFVMPWAEKVEKDSNGRIKVQVYPSMQLGGKAEQLLPQVRDGVVDIVWALPGFTPGVMPKLEIFELPFLHRSTHATVMALQDYVPKYMKKDFEPYHVLLVHCHAGALFMTKDPINKVEDFKGMKLRSYSRTNAWILEALGVAPLQVALPELAPMLSKGTVTGSILPYEIAPSVKMQDLTDYFTTLAPPQPRLSTAIFTLPDEQGEVREPAARPEEGDRRQFRPQPGPTAIKTWDQIEVDGEKVMRAKSKNKFVQLSPAETAKFKTKVQPVFDRFKKLLNDGGDDGKQDPCRGRGPGGEVFEVGDPAFPGRASTAGNRRWLSARASAARPTGPVGRALHGIAIVLAILGGLLSCAMAAIVTVERDRPLPVLARRFPATTTSSASCAAARSLRSCRIASSSAATCWPISSPRRRRRSVKAVLDAIGNFLFLAAVDHVHLAAVSTACSKCGSRPSRSRPSRSTDGGRSRSTSSAWSS